MKASIVDKNSGEIVYSVEILGNPFKPDSIKESGTKKDEYLEKMRLWYEEINLTKKIVDSLESKVDYHMTLIRNVIDKDKYDLVTEDMPDYSKYPEYIKRTPPRRHGGPFDHTIF